MAISIPSTKIYEQNNNIIKDNKIDYIEVNSKEVVPNNEYETRVYNIDIIKEENFSLIEKTVQEQKGFAETLNNGARVYHATGTKIYDTYLTLDIQIPKTQKNSYIKKLYSGKRESGENYISIEKKYNTDKNALYGEVAFSFKIDTAESNPNVSFPVTFDYDRIRNELDSYLDFPSDLANIDKISIEGKISLQRVYTTFKCTSFPEDIGIGFIDVFISPEIILDFNGTGGELADSAVEMLTNDIFSFSFTNAQNYETDWQNVEIYDSNEEYFLLKNLQILTDRTIVSCASIVSPSLPINFNMLYPSKAIQIKQKVNSVVLSLYGDKIGIDLTDKTITLPEDKPIDEAKYSYSFEGNELMQTSNYLFDKETNVKNLAIIKQFTDTLNNYKDGKETATLKLSIGEYYDNKDGTLRISTKKENLPMTFKIGDIVIPYIPSTTIGKDKPMSLYKDGSPKQFRVTRVKPYYSGACWQEIDIQEIAYEAREQ